MITIKKHIILAFTIFSVSSAVYAGPTVAPIETGLGQAQVIIQKVSTELSKLLKTDKGKDNDQVGSPTKNAQKEKAIKNETLVTEQDATPLIPEFFIQELTKKEPDVKKVQELAKKKMLIDSKTIYAENPAEMLSVFDKDSETKIKNTAPKDALVLNSQEAMQSAYHLALEQGRAIAQKSFALMEKGEKHKSDTQKRQTHVELEKGNALANQNTADILNEILVLRSMMLEIDSLQQMQTKSISILQ